MLLGDQASDHQVQLITIHSLTTMIDPCVIIIINFF